MKHSGIKVIAIDFDGTLVESNNIKDRAFETIFSEWPDHKNKMMEWQLDHNTIDRQEKFRYFVEDVLFLSDNKLIEKLTTRFSKLTKQGIIECPFVKGALNFLDYIQDWSMIYLVSATPQQELNDIIEARGLKKFFKNVYGAPIDKVEVLLRIMTNEKISANEILYIGDSPEDQKAARILGIKFIGRQSDRVLNSDLNNIYLDFFKIKDHLLKVYSLT